jgi:hypothetical protein
MVTLALHASRCSVGLGQARPWIVQESLREDDEAPGKLLASANVGDVALSSAVTPLLVRHFNVRAAERGG